MSRFNLRDTGRVNLDRILAELRDERTAIDEAILVLERLARGTGKRRGRPPKWLADLVNADNRPKPAAKRAAKQSE